MNCPRRNLTLYAVVLSVLLTMIVPPVLTWAQGASGDTNSDTTKKQKKHRHKKLTTDSAAEPASTTSPPAAAVSTPEANSPGTAPAPATPATPSKTKTASGNSSPEIAAAQASSKVWVNLDSGIYHKKGRWYGKTKNGKFMTEAEAKAAGYKQSQRN
jgi:hypothetical protein